jgi:hypothetical protein
VTDLAAVPASTLDPASPAPGSLVQLLAQPAYEASLVYVLLNVGDGDSQVLLLPPDPRTGARRVVVVDVATTRKVPSLLRELHAVGLLTDPAGSPGQVRLLVATHPHLDHIGGMVDLLDLDPQDAGFVEEFWEPGFYFPQPMFHALMSRLESSRIRRLQPSSGTSVTLDDVRITVVAPGVGLRTRFDTYGVQVNDASIVLMVEYPAQRVYDEPDPANPGRVDRGLTRPKSWRLLLGADAQFTSWAQSTVDFPDLQNEQNGTLVDELRAARGTDYLKSDVFKVSHHASKHGINVELLERVAAPVTLVSTQGPRSRHGFPHVLAMEAVRESREAVAKSGGGHRPDHELGIQLTGQSLVTGDALGSVAVVVPPSRGRDLAVFRLMDERAGRIALAEARRVRRP